MAFLSNKFPYTLALSNWKSTLGTALRVLHEFEREIQSQKAHLFSIEMLYVYATQNFNLNPIYYYVKFTISIHLLSTPCWLVTPKFPLCIITYGKLDPVSYKGGTVSRGVGEEVCVALVSLLVYICVMPYLISISIYLELLFILGYSVTHSAHTHIF